MTKEELGSMWFHGLGRDDVKNSIKECLATPSSPQKTTLQNNKIKKKKNNSNVNFFINVINVWALL